jgi:hypothetical protein
MEAAVSHVLSISTEFVVVGVVARTHPVARVHQSHGQGRRGPEMAMPCGRLP